MDEEVSVFNYLQCVFSSDSDYYFYSNIFRAYELEFCEKFTKQEVCFNEDEFSDCQCPQSVLFQKVYTINFIGGTSQSDAIGY